MDNIFSAIFTPFFVTFIRVPFLAISFKQLALTLSRGADAKTVEFVVCMVLEKNDHQYAHLL